MPDGLRLGYNAILHLTHTSIGIYYYYWRTLGKPTDILLLRILKRLKQKDQTFVPGAEFKELEDDVQMFAKHQVHTYFPDSHALMLSLVSGPGSTEKVYAKLKAEISSVNAEYELQSAKARQDQNRGITYTSRTKFYYDLSAKMNPFLTRIRQLSYMETGQLQAFSLLLFWGRQSYPDMATLYMSEGTHRPSDAEADEPLLDIASRLKEDDQYCSPVMEVEMLQSEIDYLAEYEVKSYFPKSFRLLSTWVPKAAEAYATASYDEIKAKITKSHAAVERRFVQYKYDQKRPTSDWASNAMGGFIPQIAELSEKPGGFLLAIDLLLYLGQHSYTEFEEWQEILDPIGGLPAQQILDLTKNDESFIGKNFGPRPSDKLSDVLLAKLLERARDEKVRNGQIKEYLAPLLDSVPYLSNSVLTHTS